MKDYHNHVSPGDSNNDCDRSDIGDCESDAIVNASHHSNIKEVDCEAFPSNTNTSNDDSQPETTSRNIAPVSDALMSIPAQTDEAFPSNIAISNDSQPETKSRNIEPINADASPFSSTPAPTTGNLTRHGDNSLLNSKNNQETTSIASLETTPKDQCLKESYPTDANSIIGIISTSYFYLV